MKCPECHTEVDEKLRYCPECGSPMPEKKEAEKPQGKEDNEPKLGKKMMIFIIAGMTFLIIFGFMYCMNHKNDPDYFRTLIDPDSTLADKDLVVFDTVAIDTAEAKKAEKEEKKEAEKIFNSIRRKAEPEEKKETTEASGEETTTPESQSQPAAPAPEAAPTPKVEAIETE